MRLTSELSISGSTLYVGLTSTGLYFFVAIFALFRKREEKSVKTMIQDTKETSLNFRQYIFFNRSPAVFKGFFCIFCNKLDFGGYCNFWMLNVICQGTTRTHRPQ